MERYCVPEEKVNGVSGHDSANNNYWANEMNFVMNHAPSAGSIARLVDQQSNALPLCYGRPRQKTRIG